MAKEIHEQPEVVGHTLAHYHRYGRRARGVTDVDLPFDFRSPHRDFDHHSAWATIVMPAWWRVTGSSDFARVAGRGRYRLGVPLSRRAARARESRRFVASQSCETRRTCSGRSLRYARAHRQHVLAVVNVPGSSIARESDVVMPTLAGPEIGVASTRFHSANWRRWPARYRRRPCPRRARRKATKKSIWSNALIEMPRHLNEAIGARTPDRKHCSPAIFAKSRDVLYLGRGHQLSGWHSRARSSSKKSPTFMPKVTRQASLKTVRSR